MGLPIRCSIDVHSLKATGNDIFVRSFPTDDLSILHTENPMRARTIKTVLYSQLTAGRLSSSIGNLSLTW